MSKTRKSASGPEAGCRTVGMRQTRRAGGARGATARVLSPPEANELLMELVVSRENMIAAYARVVGNKGAAGIDKMPVVDLKPFLVMPKACGARRALAAHQRRSAGRSLPAASRASCFACGA